MGREGLMGSNEKEKFKISFAVFQKTILDFQLKSHENFLRPFVYLFKNVDKDNNGIIDEVEIYIDNKLIFIFKKIFCICLA